jgi:Uncharacterized membrane protein
MSALAIPLILAAVAVYGLWRRVNVYEALLAGIGEGFSVMLRIAPAMIALLSAVAMLRESGALDMLAEALAPLLNTVGIPAETTALMLMRPLSGSGALGICSELIAAHGPDSAVGRTAAVMLGSTETTFYTIAVYFGAAGVSRTRYAIPAALCADLSGFLAAAFAVRLFFGYSA